MSPNYESSSKLIKEGKYKNIMKIEWLGQMVASLCWICSMYYYGLNSVGDNLQLCAGIAWFIANLASINKS